MAKRKFSFMASLVIAVSICSICSAPPAYASDSGLHKITVTDAMTAKNADGTNKQTGCESVGGYDRKESVKKIVLAHSITKSEEATYREICKEEGLDFDKLYNGIGENAGELVVSFNFSSITPRYGWLSKSGMGAVCWGYCRDLNEGWVKSGWARIGDKWYYFNSSGTAVSSKTIMIDSKSYTFNADCAWIQ